MPRTTRSNIAEFAENDYDIIVTVGFALGVATAEAAALYPDVTFIGVDQFQGETLANVVGLVFHEDHSGYLAGVLAARLTQIECDCRRAGHRPGAAGGGLQGRLRGGRAGDQPGH